MKLWVILKKINEESELGIWSERCFDFLKMTSVYSILHLSYVYDCFVHEYTMCKLSDTILIFVTNMLFV